MALSTVYPEKKIHLKKCLKEKKNNLSAKRKPAAPASYQLCGACGMCVQ